MTATGSRLLATRRSMLDRLPNWEDRVKWQEFFDNYWRLIYGVARKAGLSDTEAQEVVQETVIGVARNITAYDRAAGSFKNWLLQFTRWRIADQLRKRTLGGLRKVESPAWATPAHELVPDDGCTSFETVWDEEWKRSVFASAIERVKSKVPARHFQIFDCSVLKSWPAPKVATTLRVSLAQVYLIKHRVAGMLKKEVAALERRR